MNEELTELLMYPTQEQLDSARTPGSVVDLVFRADAACRLYTVFLDHDSWLLERVTLCRRWLIYDDHHWGVGAVIMPGQTLEVVIRNLYWKQGMERPEVKLELYVDAQTTQMEQMRKEAEYLRTEQRRLREQELKRAREAAIKEEEAARRTRAPGPPDIIRRLQEMAAQQQAEAVRRTEAQIAIPPPQPAPPQPTRFSELDIEDDE